MEVRRIGPDGGFLREFTDVRKRVQHLETRPSGVIATRDMFIVTDPATGVKTIMGTLPDGSTGFQPFVGDIVPPPVATAPTATAQPGTMTITWDGTFVGGAEQPADFEHLNVIAHKIVGGSTVLSLEAGAIRLPFESLIVNTDIISFGEQWQFSFESEDYNGNISARSARSAVLDVLSYVDDSLVGEALADLAEAAQTAQEAAQTAQNAAGAAQDDADAAAAAALAASNLAGSKGVVYTQSTAPSGDYSGLWIDTAHNNIPRRFLGVRSALVANLGGGASVATRLTSLGWAVSAIATTPSLADASKYDLVAFDAGYAGLLAAPQARAAELFERGVSVFTAGNDTTAMSPLFTGSAQRGTPKNNITPVTGHAAGTGWNSYADSDLLLYLTGANSAATITGTTLVTSLGTNQPINLVMEHATNFARWAHVQTYGTPSDVLNAHLGWISNNWVAIQDQGVVAAAAAAAAAQTKADQAFSNAATAATAAGTAQTTADSKNRAWYQTDQPTGTGHKIGDLWFDTDDNYKVRTWNGTIWQTTQDSWTAQQTADSKGITYTQSVTPPVSARLPQNLWNDTSLGDDKVVVKYWSTVAGAWTPIADKAATEARTVADSKGETIYSDTEPTVAQRLAQNLWVDTTNGINLNKRWNGSAWVTVVDTRIPATATAVTAADAKAQTALNDAATKSIIYTQSTTPPVSARLPQTIWNDTSLGLNNVVVKYWSTTAGAWTALVDKDATEARVVADSKGETIYSSTEPSVDKRLTQNLWIDTTGGLNLNKRWNGSGWVTVVDARIPSTAAAVTAADTKAQDALNSAAAKTVVYTQSTTPPVEARLPQTLWNDTSLGLNNVIVKYWNGSAWTALADKTATDAAVVADSKGETIYSSSEPAVAKRLPQNLWIDTTGGLNLNKRWDGAGWVVVVDSRIPSTATAVTAADAKAQTALNDAATKSIIFTQSTTPPVSARLPQTLWNDTSLGLNNVVVKYWDTVGLAWTALADKAATDAATLAGNKSKVVYSNTAPTGADANVLTLWIDTTGGANTPKKWVSGITWTAVTDKVATDAAATAASKGEVIYSSSTPTAAQQLPQNLWVDTTGGLNMHKRWNTGTSAWVVVADSRIAQTITDLTALSSQVSSVSAQADRSITTFYGSSTPTGAQEGDLWLSGVAGTPMKRYNNVGTWVNFEDPNVTAAYTKAGDAQAAADAKVRTFAQTSAPTGMVPNDVGDLWMDTDDKNKMYRYDGAAWVAVRDDTIADAQGTANTALSTASSAVTAAGAAQTTADGKNTSYYQTSQPTGGAYKVGDLWFDTDDNYKMRTYTGSIWQLTQDSAGAQAAAISAAATDAQTKATAAQNAAITAAAADAATKASQAESNAIAAAATDAQTKANTAKQQAIDAAATAAQLMANGAEQSAIDAAALDAQTKADLAEQAAIDAAAIDAQAKATLAKTEALAAAAIDAQTRATQAKADAQTAAALDATAKADAAQMAAIQAQAYSLNPSFEDWTGTYPNYYSAFNAAPTKETTTVRTGKYAVRFNSPDATTQRGITSSSFMAHAPNLEYFTLELDVRLDSGSSFGGSGVLLDWTGMTGGNRVAVSLATEIPTPIVGKWYRVTKVLRRPTTATGTLTGYNMWLMGQYNSGLGTMAVKNVIFDWINIRPSTTEEITAYGTPASISSTNASVSALSDTVNTKTKSWFQPGQPPLTGNTTGDLWIDTDDNNKIYAWNGAWAVASDQRIESLNTAVTAAQTSANGKNKVIYSTSAASGTTGYVAGDTWFQRDGSNNIIAQWEFTNAWQSRKVDDAMIANLNAAKIIAGTLDAQRIGANTIGASKLIISDMEELIPNPFFHPSGEPVVNGTIVSTASTAVSAGAPFPYAYQTVMRDNHPFGTPNIAVKQGDQFYVEVWVATATAIRNFNLYMFGATQPSGGLTAKLSSGNIAPTSTWTKVTMDYTVPAGFNYIKPVLQVDTVGGETAPQLTWYASGWSMKRKNTGKLIVDGAIQANSAIIATGAIGNAHIGDAAIDTAEIKDAAVKSAKIEDLAVTNAKIANATIDDAKIANISAGKITVGQLKGWQIEANAIDASKLNVTLGGSNLVSNSSFEVDSDSNGLADSWSVWVRGTGDAGRTLVSTRTTGLFPGSTFAQRVTSNNVSNAEQSSLQSTQLFSIAPGASATISVYGRASVAGNFPISIRCEDDAGAYKGDAQFIAPLTTTANRYVGTVIIPAGTTRGKMTISTPVSISSGHWFEFDGIQVELGDVASSWGPKTEELLPGTIKAGMIAADAVTATNIAATAIDGKTITGATIQTETTANRGIKLTSTELGGWDGAGVKNFSLTSAGVLAIRGSIESGSTIKGATLTGAGIETTTTANRGVKIQSTGVSAYDGSGNMTFKVDASTGIVEAPGLKANSIEGDKIAAKTIGVDKLTVQDFSNYVENPGFESGDLRGWDVIGGWYINNAAPHSGTYKALTAYNGTTQSITNKAEVTLPVGGKVRVKFRIYSETPSVSGSQAILSLFDVATGTLESVTPIVQAGQWIEIDRELTAATAGAKRLQIATTGTGSGYLRVDSIVMNRMMNGELIVDGAIDGKTITGATIQTEATASRGIKLTSTELAGYDAAGVKNFSLTSAGALSVRGDIESGSTIKGATLSGTGIETTSTANRGVKIKSTGVSAYDGTGNLTFKVDGSTGIVEAPGILANSIKGDKIQAGTVSADRLLISDFTNLIDDPSIFGPGWTKGANPASSSIVADANEKVNVWRFNALGQQVDVVNANVIPVTTADRFVLSMRAYSTLNASGYLRINWYTETMAFISVVDLTVPANANAWAPYSLPNVTPPATAKFMKIQPIIGATATTGYILYGSMTLRRRFGGELIVDGAINGQTITGATITGGTVQSEVTASRGIKLTSAELAGYDGAGIKNFSLTSAGVLSIRGSIESGSTIKGVTLSGAGIETTTATNRGVKITSNGVSAYDASGNMTFKVDAASGVVEAPGMKANSITGDMIAGQTITAKNILIGDFANLATIDEVNGITVSSYGQTMVSAGYNKLVNDAGSFLMFTDQRGPVPYKAGDVLYYEFTAKATAATTVQFGQWNYDLLGGNATNSSPTLNIGTTDTPITGQITVTNVMANAKQFVVGLQSVANKGIQVKGVKVYKKYGGQLIVDGAIDGKTITGATIQSEVTASRGIKLTSAELAGYDGAGVKNFSLTSGGALSIRGDIESGSKIKGVTLEGAGIETSNVTDRGVKIKSTGVTAYDGSGNMTFKVDAASGEVQAPGIKANSIKGDKIESGTVTADKILVTGSNLHTDPGFRDAAGWMLDTGVTVATTGGRTGGGSLTIPASAVQRGGYYGVNYPDKRTVVKSKGLYRVSVMVKSDTAMPAGVASVWFRAYKPDNTMAFATPMNVYSPAIAANTWGEVTGIFEVPDGYTQAAIGLYKEASFNAALTYSDVFVQQAATGELIVDGAIKTAHMTSGTIDAGVISAGTLTATQIKGKSVSIDKLLITSTDNLIQEGDFSAEGASWQLPANIVINATAGRKTLPAMVVTNTAALQTSYNSVGSPTKVPIEFQSDAGNAYRLDAWVKCTASVPVSGAFIGARFTSTTGATTERIAVYSTSVSTSSTPPSAWQTPQIIPANTWTQISGVVTAPADTISVAFSVNSAASLSTGTLTWDTVSVTRATNGRLVVDGSITADKLEANLILATKIVAGDPDGTHAEMSPQGFRVFADAVEDGAPSTEVVRLGVAESNDYFAVTKADGTLAATISQDGTGAFGQVYANEGLYYKGSELTDFINTGRLIARAYRNTSSLYNAGSGVTQPYVRLDRVPLKKGNLYRISTGPVRMDHDANTLGYTTIWYKFSSTDENVQANAGAGSASIAETVSDAPPVRTSDATMGLIAPTEDGWGSFLFSFTSQGPGQVGLRSSTSAPFRMLVEDLGKDVGTSGIYLDGTNPPPPAVNNYQKKFYATQNMNYKGDGSQYNWDLGHAYQGWSPAGYGNLKSIQVMQNMTSDLSGATINWMRMYWNFPHWYYNSGGTARIGVHGHSSVPSTYSGTTIIHTSGGWPKPGAKWVDIPSAYWGGFASGAYKGLLLDGVGADYAYYGYADMPVIEINYTK